VTASRAHHRFTVGDRARLEVEIAAGDVKVRTAPHDAVVLTIDTADPSQVEIIQVGDSISVRHLGRWGRKRHVVVVAEVPEGADIRIITVSADVRLDGRLGATQARTVSGNIGIERIDRGNLDSTSGDLHLTTSDGALNVSTVSGNVSVGQIRGRLTASLTSGDLRVDLVDGDVEVSTMSGDVAIGRCDGDSLSVKSVSGDLAIGLPSGIRVEPDISTLSGSTSLPKPSKDSFGAGFGETRRRVRLRLRTVSGDIRLLRA
jgi:DUF4097 and DUF4098 domain-containing protein YvlB